LHFQLLLRIVQESLLARAPKTDNVTYKTCRKEETAFHADKTLELALRF
jgi:hypothetical protein